MHYICFLTLLVYCSAKESKSKRSPSRDYCGDRENEWMDGLEDMAGNESSELLLCM